WVSSNYGATLDVSAPGEDIFSTWPVGGDNYFALSGTSQATPHVSGLTSLIKSYVPGLGVDEIRSIINTTADDLGTSGWDPVFGHGRINAYSAMLAADNATIRIVASAPPDGAIDAGQPSDPNGADPGGWDRVEITFDGNALSLVPEDFSVGTNSRVVTPPLVNSVVPDPNAAPDSGRVTVILDRAIDPLAWTTVRHDFSGTSVRLGFLPGDVNNDGTSNADDILALIDGLSGTATWESWQTDMDRSEESDAADLLRLIDLLHGAGVYEPYLDQSLPN
ncbi:MAG: S8 family serine peptidase, partial [Planctomycetes bacterium]|nr:S8 family serine peptidase [Planctomycetota bacterium]